MFLACFISRAQDLHKTKTLECDLTDAELVCEAREQNAEAWRTLYQRFLPSVWRYAYALLGDTHLAEDVVGEVMLAFLKGIDQIDTKSPRISAWLRSVVRHKVADHHRQSIRSRERLVALGVRSKSEIRKNSPSQLLELVETRTQVLEILEDMPERQRLALEWKYVEELRVQEIAERLGETEKAVEATLYRARRAFRRRFELVESPKEPGVPSRGSFGPQAEAGKPPQRE